MIKLVANSVTALSLMLSASVASPAWSAGKAGHSANCPHAKQKQAKQQPVAVKPQPARGVALIDKRKLDVQVLSFGP
ncbi:MAG: hypothetical protein ACJ8FC_11210 [Sphingomicrobium sp.]|jgi:hypothetical protein